jgi:hypothetical protein
VIYLTVKLETKIQKWCGLSTDTKPTPSDIGSIFYETDTNLEYKWTGSEWVTTSYKNIALTNKEGFHPENALVNPIDITTLMQDSDGNIAIRGAVTTDEGGFREGFVGAALGKSLGTCTFTTGSKTVTGSGFLSGDIRIKDYIKLGTDTDSDWGSIENIISDTEISLASNYTGTGGSGTSYYTKLKPIIGSGGSITVGTDQCTIGSGTTNSSKTAIERDIDYGPLVASIQLSISQRIANQAAYAGFTDDMVSPTTVAWFKFDGTTDTAVTCESSFKNSATKETTTVTLPSGLATSVAHRYRIEITQEYVAFYIGKAGISDDILVAKHRNNIPDLYAYMKLGIGFVNGTGAASNTNIVADYVFVNNCNAIQMQPSFSGAALTTSPQPVYVVQNLSAGALNADLVQSIDVSSYRTAILHVTGTFSGTLSVYGSLDNISYTLIAVAPLTSLSNVPFSTISNTGLYMIPLGFKFLRVRMTSYTSGTATGSISLMSDAPSSFMAFGRVYTEGIAAHDSGISGQPVRIGARALTSSYTAVSTGDTADLITTLVGALIVRANSIPENSINASITLTDNSNTQLFAAAGSGIRNYVTSMQLQNTHATVATTLILKDSSTSKFTINLPANMSAPVCINFTDPILMSANTVTNVACGTTGSNVLVNAQGYKAP